MIKVLLIINTIIVLACIRKLCISHHKVDINHIFCFSFGYLYYCIIPFICFEWKMSFSGIAYNNMISIYNNISESRVCYYIITSLTFYLSFVIGSMQGRIKYKLINRVSIFHTQDANFNYTQKIAYPIVVLLGIIILFMNRASLFHGYTYLVTVDSYDSTRVLLSVYEFVVVICSLYYLNSNPQYSLNKIIFNKWMLLFIVYSLLLISTGGRLYVITALLSFVIFLSFSENMNFRLIVLLAFGALFALIMGLIGISRLGFVGLDFKLAVFNILEEPLYTNYSNITYLYNYSPVNIFCIPTTLLSAIVNLLPTRLFPWKLDYIKYITDIYPQIEQPLGATHYYTSYNAGLGLLLSLFLFYFIGKRMSRIRKSYEDADVTKRTIYCLVCANLAFSMFRDPIATSLIKNIIEFSVILPWFISALNDFLYKEGLK